MSDIKWIKVAVDMFEDSKIEFIRSLPEGDSIIVTWLQMLSIAGTSNMGGYLLVTEGIPYTEQLLCNKLRRNPVFMQFAIETLIKLKMINIEDGPFHISNWEKHQNIDGMEKVREQTRKRTIKYRENKRLQLTSGDATVTSQRDGRVTVSDAIELDKEKEKDLKDSVPKGTSRTKFIPPTIDQVTDYCDERNKGVDPEKWYDHYTANGWKVGKNAMKDWKAAIRTWERKNTSSSTSTVARTGQAAHHKKYDPELEYRRREIAFNKWIDKGNDPDEFIYQPT